MLNRVVLCVVVCGGVACERSLAGSSGQEQSGESSAGAAAQVQSAPTLGSIQLSASSSTEQVFGALLAAYRAGPVAERITFETEDASGVVKSDVWLRVDGGNLEPTDRSPARSACLRIDAGKAIIVAQGDRLTFAHSLNPTTYYECIVEGGFNAGLLRQLPESPLPQLSLTFAELTKPVAARYDLRMATWENVEAASGNPGVVVLSGTLANLPILLTIDRASHRLRGYELSYGAAEEGAKKLRASVETQVVNDLGAWPLSLDGRTKVLSVADLKPLPPKVEVGQTVPALGLMREDLSGWSLLDALEQLANKQPKATATVAAALVMVSPDADAKALAEARLALQGATRYARDLEMQRMQGLADSPRLVVASVGVLELSDVSRERIKALAAQWGERLKVKGEINPDVAPQQLWTSAGVATLQQMAPAQTCAVIVVDQSQRLLAAIPLDSRLLNEEAMVGELRAILSTEAVVPADGK